MINATAKTLIETWRLGFVASADATGRVNLSPKGTFVVIDERTLGFAEMRSPQTVANIRDRAEVEVNFVDILTRKGARLRGAARIAEPGSDEFTALLPRFTQHWPDLQPMMNALVLIDVTDCKPLASPAYEAGASEDDLRATWLNKINEAAR
ncbi:MAG: pyridoxamine 5'-phosphate oxidase family protein [Paracoccaceae bacterium]